MGDNTQNMWKILGKDALYVEFSDVFKERIIELANEIDNGEKFIEIVKDSEIQYLFNGSTETHAFNIFPNKETSVEDIQYMADIILAIATKDESFMFVTLEGKYQKCIVNVRTDEEPELIGANRTEGYASGKIFYPILDSLCKPGRANDSFN